MTNPPELEDLDELYIILANYSDDLNDLKKRNGKLPADAAVEAISAYCTEQVIKELEAVQLSYGDRYLATTFASGKPQTIQDRLQTLREPTKAKTVEGTDEL